MDSHCLVVEVELHSTVEAAAQHHAMEAAVARLAAMEGDC